MAFNINAQIVLSAPKNLNNISKQISSQLGKATKIDINVGNTRQLNNISKQLTNISNTFTKLNSNLKATRTSISALNSSFSKAGSSLNTLSNAQNNVTRQTNNANRSLKTQQGLLVNLAGRFGSVAKQAIAFGLISRPIYDLQRALTQSVKSAVSFEKEFVKISQVTGKSVVELGQLKTTINGLATSLGNSANELAETARVIAQTGKTAEETRIILQALARSTLAPTFGTLKDTTEGLVAALGQFNLRAGDSEAILGSLNRVSKNFAVEAEDLISVIRRTGGVFAQAAGNSRNTIGALQELISVFTAVRSTTRESADTIAAGLRTIFSRLQRRGTIEFLKQFGVQLTDAKGQFVGIFPAFDELSSKLSTLIKQGDALTLSAIAEELGGIRQIGKLLPAIAQFDKARKALTEAQRGAVEGLSGDVAKGLDTLDNRLQRVRESFNQLIRNVFESDAFQNFTKNILNSAENFLKFGNNIVESLEPILPILTTIGSFKIGSALGGFLGGGGIGKAVGGITGQATAQASQAAAQASQNAAQATQANTQILNTINSTLTRTSNQLANIFQSLEGNFRTLTTQMSNLIQSLAGFKSSTMNFGAPITGGRRRRSSGGKIFGFNSGGIVPGTGNSDTVPAMLTPGEFVIKKSSVESIGAGQLASMNKYAKGGKIRVNPGAIGGFFLSPESSDPASLQIPKGKTITISNQRVLDQLGRGLSGDDARIRDSLLAAGSKKRQERILFGRGPGKLTGKLTSQSFTTKGALRANIGEPEANAALAKGSKRRDRIKGLQKRGLATQPQQVPIEGSIAGYFPGGSDVRKNQKVAQVVNKFTKKGLEDAVVSASTEINSLFDVGALNFDESKLKNAAARLASDPNAVSTTEGFAFEGIIQGLTGATLAGNQSNFDFPSSSIGGARDKLANFFTSGIEGIASLIKGDAKRSNTSKALSSIVNKINNDINKGILEGVQIVTKASGGSISGQDTVPALLTPGEFVFNKKSASRIGYGNLNRMNKKGIQGFNKGGIVGFNNGGPAKATGGGGRDVVGAVFALQSLAATTLDADSTLGNFTNQLTTALFALTAFQGMLPTGALKDLDVKFKAFTKDLSRKAAFSTLRSGGGRDAAMAAARRTAIGTTALGAAGGAIGGAVVGKVIGDMAAKAIADSLFGKQEEIAGVKGSASSADAASRGQLEGAISGLGAGAGAGAGAGFLLGGPVGAAIGAAIGGASGAIGGAIIGAINAPLEQGAFNAAKALEKSGKNLSSSLSNVEKDLSAKNLGVLASTLGDATVNFSGGVAAFQKKFDEGVTAAGIGLSLIPDSLLSGVDSIFDSSLSNANRSLNNTNKAIADLGKLINPEDIKRAKEVNQKALALLLEDGGIFGQISNIDFSSDFFGDFKGLDAFNQTIQEAANNGNTLAKSFLLNQKNLAKLQVQQDASAKAQIAQASGNKADKQTAAFLGSAQGAGLAQLAVTGDDASFRKALDETTKDLDGPVQQALTEYYFSLRDGAKSQGEAGAEAAKTARLLNESQVEIDKFITGLNEATNALKFAAEQTEAAFANVGSTLDLLTGGGKITALQTADPFSAGAAGEAARQQGIASVGRATGVDVTPIQNFQGAIDDLPDIGEKVLQKVKESGESISPQEVSNLFIEEIEKSTGPLGGQLKAAISGGIEGASRQLAGGGEIGADALKKAIENGKLLEMLDKGGEAAQKAIATLVDSLQKLNDNIAEQAQLEFDQLKKNREFEQTLLKKREQLEGKIAAISGGAGPGFGSARAEVQARAVAQAGTADSGALLARRGAAQQALSQFRQAQQDGTTGLSATEQATQLAGLTNELDSTTEALKILSDDTSQLAEIEKEANRLRKQQQDALGGLDKIVTGVAGGDQGAIQATLNQQNALLKVFSGQQLGGGEQLGLLKSLGDADFANLVDFAGEEVGVQDASGELRKNLTLGLTQSLRNTPLGQALGPTLDLLVKKFSEPEKTIEDLAKEANSIAIKQLSILQQIAGQDAAVGDEQLAISRESVANQDAVFQREAQNVANILGGPQEPGTPPAGTPAAGAAGAPAPQLPGAAGAATGAAAQQQAGLVEVGGNRVAFVPEQVGQDVDIGALQAQADAVQAQKSQAIADAQGAEAAKIAQEEADIEKRLADLGPTEQISSAEIRAQGRAERRQESGGIGGALASGFGAIFGAGGAQTEDFFGSTGGFVGTVGAMLGGDFRLGGDANLGFGGPSDEEKAKLAAQARVQREAEKKRLQQQQVDLQTQKASRIADAGSAAGASFAEKESAAAKAVSSGIAQNEANAAARQRNQAGAAAAFAENQTRQKAEFKQKQRARVSSERLATGAIDAETLERAEELRRQRTGQTPEGIGIAGGIPSSNVFKSVGADEAKLRSADAIRRGLSADPDSEEFRKARKKQISLTGGGIRGELEAGRTAKAQSFQEQQAKKREAVQANREALKVQNQFRKGEITRDEAEEKIRGIRKQQFGGQQVDEAAKPDAESPTVKLQESIVAGSEQGAMKFAEVFNQFAAMLPEQISAVIEPLELVGTDSLGAAVGDQVVPKVEDVLKGFFNKTEGVPAPTQGAGTGN